MAVSLRTGTYGNYYGNDYNSSNALNQSQMELNATFIFGYLTNQGWTINAISALLGNMTAESSINPGRWQSDRVGGNSSGHGYGLVQWTPYTKYTDWVSGDPSTMDNNLSRIDYEMENGIQWIATGEYRNMSFSDFAHSGATPQELAAAFLLCYERPADQSISVQNYRGSLANDWYEFLTGATPPTPPPTPTPGSNRRRKYKFLLFNKRRRIF